MKGWFDAFRTDGGPTLYNFNNRTSVTADVTIITILTVFCTLYVAFLIIFPGIRKERFTTFLTVTLSLFVGATVLVAMYGAGWHVGRAPISATYRAYSTEKMNATLGVYIGLRHVNVTLRGEDDSDIDFNEQFQWQTSDKMGHTFKEAIRRGLPYPILTVAEYLSLGQEGLAWGGQYRAAGYCASVMLWASLITWALMNLMIVVVPRYGTILMTLCGALLLATAGGYAALVPTPPLIVYLEGGALHLQLGWCFWLVLTAGLVCLVTGLIAGLVELVYPHTFSTILEVNYDTPYDRHIIIEDSRGRRYQKKRVSGKNSNKLEEPSGIGSRILRHLSSKSRMREDGESQASEPTRQQPSVKSPWRYPYATSMSNTESLGTSASNNNGMVMGDFQYHLPRAGKNDPKLRDVSTWYSRPTNVD